LDLGRRAVDLVGEQQVREHRPERRRELAGLLVVDPRADQVRRHEVGRELDAPEGAADRSGERLDGQRLRQARHAFDQQVALREHRHQHALEEAILPDDDALDLVEDALHQRGDVGAAVDQCAHVPGFHGSWDQNGDMPAELAAVSIGTAKPMPMNTRCSVGFMIAVTMPITSPSAVTSGPPEFPGLAAASNWIRLVSSRSPSGERNSRRKPETMPALALGPMPNGNPTATTWSPPARSRGERIVAATRSSGIDCACSTARSRSGVRPRIDASASSPSAKSTRRRGAPTTTWKFVRIVPVSTMTTPVPTLRSSSGWPGFSA